MACSYAISGHAFIGCPRDAEAFQEIIQRIWHDLPVPGQRPTLVHWRKDYDPVASPGAEPDQFKIARTSDPATNPVFILFARTVGTPIRPPTAGWEELRRWLDSNGWGFIALLGDAEFTDAHDPPDGMIPLSGTMFELFDALRTGNQTDLRIYDLSRIAPVMESLSTCANFQEAWCARLLEQLGKGHAVRSPATDAEFEEQVRADLRAAFGLSPLDPFTDRLPGLEPIDDLPLLFGRDGLIDAMNRRVFQDDAGCIPILGVSGAGKSSFLRAGLMRTWFRQSPAGPGLRFPTHAILFEPDQLASIGTDPMEALGRLLTGAPGSSATRLVGPLPGPLAATVPELPPPTGDIDIDLSLALAWWQRIIGGLQAVSGKRHRLILICDQAEQIGARARGQAQDLESQTGLPVTPLLDLAWKRFTAFLGLLGGLLPPDKITRHTSKSLADMALRVRCQLVLGLHRLSALNLWPIAHSRVSVPFEVSPLMNPDEWEAVIEGTCSAYNLQMDPDLCEAMATEASELSRENQPIASDPHSRADIRSSAASVLPQVCVALQRIMTAWCGAHRSNAELTAQDRILDRVTYEPLRSIQHSIEYLGEEAWRGWQNQLAARRGLDARGFLEARTLAEEGDRRFGDLLAGLVDARDEVYQDLTLLPRRHPRAARQDELVEQLRRQRLLTTTELRRQDGQEATHYLRLPHRSILDHWSRARQWVLGSRPRLDAKDSLKALAKLKLVADQWPAELIAPFVDLALNWIGTGEGADRILIHYLQTGLVARLNPDDVDVHTDSPLGILPFAVMAGADLCFAKLLIDRCAEHPSWPGKMGSWLTVSAECGSTELLGFVLSAGRATDATINWVDDRDGFFPLLLAAQNGHDAVVAQLLKRGALPQQVNPRNGTFPLLQAAQNGHDEVVGHLLEHGAQPNQVDTQNGNFPLLLAAQNGHNGVVSQLLEHGALPQQVNPRNGTFPLLLAAQNGHDGVVAHLLEHDAQPNQVDTQNRNSPLLMASQDGHEAVVTHLLAYGARPDQSDERTYMFPLLQAAQNGHDAVVARLLEYGARPDRVDGQTGNFPLLMAAQHGHDAVVAHLLAYGAPPNQVNSQTGTFPLFRAAQNGHDAVVVHLLAHGALPNQVDYQNGAFPLDVAAENGHESVVARLLEHGAPPNQVNDQTGTFPLLMAAQNGYDVAVAHLLEFCALPNHVHDQTGCFPLLQAAQNGHEAVVACLLAHGALPNQVNDQTGTFPLLQAAQSGHTQVVAHLLQHGAKPNQVDDQNSNFPLLMAAQNGHVDVVFRLLEHGAAASQTGKLSGFFPLLQAALNGHDVVVTRLLEHGAQPNQVNLVNGSFPLLLAAHNGHDTVVAQLLEHDALPNQVDERTGIFPLLQAAQDGHDAVVARLLKHGAQPNQIHDQTGIFPLLLAAQEGYGVMVTHLLEHGALPNQVNDQNGTFPLLQAAQNGHDAIVARLLEHGALPNQANDRNGTFPLLQAAQDGHDAVAARLLEHGAKPNQANGQNGSFPLLLAAQNGNDAVVTRLIEYGAQPRHSHAATGATALTVALMGFHADVIRQLAVAEDGLNEFVSYLLEQMKRLPKPQFTSAPPADDDPPPAEPEGMPIPGDWGAVVPGERHHSGLAATISSSGISVGRFNRLLEMKICPLVPGGRLDLVKARFLIAADCLLAVEAAYLIGEELPPIPMGPNLNLGSLLRSFGVRALLPDLRVREVQQLVAALFLLSQSSPLIPLPPDAPLPLPSGTLAPRIDFSDSVWRTWRVRTGPAGPQVELPWFDKQSLVYGQVLIPPDGLNLRILDNPHILASGVQWHADRFLCVGGSVTGLWVLAEVHE